MDEIFPLNSVYHWPIAENFFHSLPSNSVPRCETGIKSLNFGIWPGFNLKLNCNATFYFLKTKHGLIYQNGLANLTWKSCMHRKYIFLFSNITCVAHDFMHYFDTSTYYHNITFKSHYQEQSSFRYAVNTEDLL